MTGPTPMIVDLSDNDTNIDMHSLLAAGVCGVIIKAYQYPNIESTYEDQYKRAITVWPVDCVHSYCFLTGDDPEAQMAGYVTATQGRPGRWLDYEENASSQCSLTQATDCYHILYGKQGYWGGIYGSDGDLLGEALDAGHFIGTGPLWIANYSQSPSHKYNLWQFAEGVSGDPIINGVVYDLSTYNGTVAECQNFMATFAKGKFKA